MKPKFPGLWVWLLCWPIALVASISSIIKYPKTGPDPMTGPASKLGFWVGMVKKLRRGEKYFAALPLFTASIPTAAYGGTPEDRAYEEYAYLCRHFRNAQLDPWSKDYVPHYMWLSAKWAGAITTETMDEFQDLLTAEEVVERFERG